MDPLSSIEVAAYLAARFAFDMHWTYKLLACHCADVGRIACVGSAYAPFPCYAANNSAQGHRLIWCIAVVHTVVAGGLAAQHVLHMFKTTTIKKKLKTRCTLCGDVLRVFSYFIFTNLLLYVLPNVCSLLLVNKKLITLLNIKSLVPSINHRQSCIDTSLCWRVRIGLNLTVDKLRTSIASPYSSP